MTGAAVLVVGAGPAGLAAAASLQQKGVSCTVLERASSVGAAWQGRYDSLRLHTVRWLSGLPGARIPRRYGRWVARRAHGARTLPQAPGLYFVGIKVELAGLIREIALGAREVAEAVPTAR